MTHSLLTASAARERMARLKESGQDPTPQTFVGEDGLLHVVLRDGGTDLILVDGKPVSFVDVLVALEAYTTLFPQHRGAEIGSFMEWHTRVWPQIRRSTAVQ